MWSRESATVLSSLAGLKKQKELEQRKQRLEREQEQSRAQAARDEELLRQITAATALVTREVVTSMSVTSQNDDMSRLTITTLNS